ncbi:MAG: four helix bundle protein [Bacteroidales bacterium]|nr:four helix bundle protein [Bacteroidales bacterium]
MSTVKRFEDLEVWKRARILCIKVYEITKTEPFSKDFGLVNQIRNSSGSVMDNIAEGFERNGKKEFSQFLSIAKGSCGEAKSQLYRALDNKYIDKNKFTEIYNLCEEIGKMLNGLINYLKESNYKGIKYKHSELKTEN